MLMLVICLSIHFLAWFDCSKSASWLTHASTTEQTKTKVEVVERENDSTVIDAIVQHLSSRNEKARQAAIFAISRISSFQVHARASVTTLSSFPDIKHLMTIRVHVGVFVLQNRAI